MAEIMKTWYTCKITEVTQKLKNNHAEQGAEAIFLSSFDASCKKTQDDYGIFAASKHI